MVLAVVFGGHYLGLFGSKNTSRTGESPDHPGAPTPPPTAVSVAPAPIPPSSTPVNPPTVPTPKPRPAPLAQPGPTVAATPPAAAALIQDWEQRIDTLLTTPGDEAAKSRELLAMLPNLPEDGQVEAVQHLSNLLADEDFKLLTPTLTNAAMAEAVLDVLMTDVLNRPNELKLPALLDVARIPNHPKAEEARDILEVYVDENYGEDWRAWKTAVDKWLKENPDE
jgi:hypothetical protein